MAPSSRTDEPGVYVALGDSISIDRYAGGEGRGGASLLARNRDDDFPQWRGRDLATLDPTLSYHLLATDGGTTSTLLDAQLPRLEGSALAPTIVTLTVGGNDLLGAYGDTRRAREVVSVVRRRVGQALVRVRSVMRQRSDPVIVGAVQSPHPSPQRAQRPERAQRADEGNWQATTAPASGDLRSSAGTGRVVGHGAPEAEPAAGTGTVQVSARPDMRPPGPSAAECAVQEVAPCNTVEFTHGFRVPNLPGIHSDPGRRLDQPGV